MSLPLVGASRSQRLEWLGVLLAIGVGVWLRSVRFWFDPISLWLDEAEWGVRLVSTPLLEQAVRPLGFLGLTKALVRTFGAYEPAIRGVSYALGILALPVAYWCARLLLERAVARLVVVWAFALHPLLIDFAREFKPYSGEVFAHLLLLATTLSALRYPLSRLRWWLAVLTPVAAFAFAYNALFAYPAVFGLLGFECWQRRNWGRLAGVSAAALVAGGLVLGLQFGVVSTIDETSYGTDYWGRKYDVFLVADRKIYEGWQPQAAWRWVLGKYAELASGPGFVPSGWHLAEAARPSPLLGKLYGGLWAVALLIGAGALFNRQRRWLLLFACPLVLMGVFNLAGKWPLGLFRVNLFSLAYAIVLGALGIDQLLQWAGRFSARFASQTRRELPGLALAALFVLPRAGFAAPQPAVKESRPWMAHSEHAHAVAKLLEAAKGEPRLPLLADHYTFHTIAYYERAHPLYKRYPLRARYQVQWNASLDVLLRSFAQSKGTVWVFISRQDYVPPARQHLGAHCTRVTELDVGTHHLVARCER